MGERGNTSVPMYRARAQRLQKALETGAPPSFVPAEMAASHSSCSQRSCPAPPYLSAWDNPQARLQFLEQIFGASPDALTVADSAHHVLWANERFLSMFGFSSADVMGRPLENLVVPPDRLAESKWLTEMLGRGERITLETKRRKSDGTLLDVSLSCSPLMQDGKMAGLCAVYRDVSDRKRVEALSSALYRVAEKSSSAHDLQQFFAAVHGIVDELMYARNFYIAFYDSATDLITFPYFVDERDGAPSSKKLGHGLTDYLIRIGEPLSATPEVLQAMEERGEVERNRRTFTGLDGRTAESE